jgi:hypothetical protein
MTRDRVAKAHPAPSHSRQGSEVISDMPMPVCRWVVVAVWALQLTIYGALTKLQNHHQINNLCVLTCSDLVIYFSVIDDKNKSISQISLPLSALL